MAGEIAPRTFQRYHATCKFTTDAFGRDRLIDDLVADDFQHLRSEMTKRWGPVAVGNEIQMVRTVFKHGYDAGLYDKAPKRHTPARTCGHVEKAQSYSAKCPVREQAHKQPRKKAETSREQARNNGGRSTATEGTDGKIGQVPPGVPPIDFGSPYI